MNDLDLFYRLGVAIAIGVMVGVERHWRERDQTPGSRTAGVRTFTLIGMLGGGTGLIERALAGSGGPAGLATAGIFLAFATTFAVFKLRESEAESRYSATSLVAAMTTFVLGALAALGDIRLAAAGGVVLTGILASREALHGFLRTLTWPELRSAIILLAMTFVVLPLAPDRAIGPFGGISPARTWTLAVLLAAISFVGYVAVKLLGASRGELVAGAIGGVVSSTAVTLANARKAAAGGEVKALAAGAAAAGAASYLRTAALIVVLAAAAAPMAVPPLIAAGIAMVGAAALLARQAAPPQGPPAAQNPLDLPSVIKATLLLAAVAFLASAASSTFGARGLIAAAALSGLADIDAVIVAVSGLLGQGLAGDTAFVAIAAGVIANTICKLAYAAIGGGVRFTAWLTLAYAAASAAGLAAWIAAAAL